MNIRESLANFINPVQKSAAVPLKLGYGGVSFDTPNPSGITDEELLRCYANDPWLYAVIDCVTQGESSVQWHLYKIKPNGDRDEITDRNNELKQLLNKPNSLQTGQDLWELGETYSLLTGKDYWRISREKGKWELNEVPSAWTRPILDKQGIEILGYRYERNGFRKDFPADEIIPFVHPNPLSPLDGISPTHTIAVDLAIHNYARLFNRYFFYNNAESGVILKTESADQTEIDRVKERYKAEHRGYGRAFNIDIFSGVTEILQAEAKHKDMHFNELMEHERKVILAAFRIPYTLLGGTDLVQRGNADAALYFFAKWVLHPRLEFLKRKLNEYLVPKFGDNLELDYDDPTPEDRQALVTEAMAGWNGGLFTRNQALTIMEYDPIDEPAGEEYKQSSNPFEGLSLGGQNKDDQSKGIVPFHKSLFDSESKAEEYWKVWVRQAETFEPKFITAMQGVYQKAIDEALGNLCEGMNRNAELFDLSKFCQSYEDAVTPVMTECLVAAIKAGKELVEPKNPHKTISVGIPPLLNEWAKKWLQTRIQWAAKEVGNTLEKLLRNILVSGFEQGEPITDIARNIRNVPGFEDRSRSLVVARTEIQSAHAQGTLEGYKQSGVVKQVKFWAALDERSCDYCREYHDHTFNLGDEMPIPLHCNCRCVYLPVVEI